MNISSIFGIAAVPGNGTYNASKFAVRGFTEAPRQELELTGGNVSATCVHFRAASKRTLPDRAG